MNLLNILILSIFVISILSTLYFYLINGIGSTPTPDFFLHSINKDLPKSLCGDIIEAGAGFGGTTLWLAKTYPTHKVIAWENAWLPFLVLWIRVMLSRYDNIVLKFGDFSSQPLNNVALIYAYLCRKGMLRVKNWVNSKTNQPILLVSSCFSLPENKPFKIFQAGKYRDEIIYFYDL